jgi:methyltransferase family protein
MKRPAELLAATGTIDALRPARRGGLSLLRRTYRAPRIVVPIRTEIPHLLNARALTGTAAEIGVKRGDFSEEILSHWQGAKLISVDPWRAFGDEEYVDLANVEQAEHDAFYEQTVDRLARFGSRSEIWRMTSLEAAAAIEDGSLDFVYIDARHDYESVREDLEAWRPKMREGAIMAGHDYLDGDLRQGDFGVKSAVDEFFRPEGVRVQATFADTPWPSWVAFLAP